jgi:hypothetical protein
MTADRWWGRVQTVAAPNLCWSEPQLSDVKMLLRDDGALEGDLNSTNTLTTFNFSDRVRVLVRYKAKDSGAIKEGRESRPVIAALPLVPDCLAGRARLASGDVGVGAGVSGG